MKVATDVAAYKRSTGKKVYDPVREEEKLKTLRGLSDNEFNNQTPLPLLVLYKRHVHQNTQSLYQNQWIADIYDLLLDYDITIVAEHVIKVEQALVGVPGTKLEDIKTVCSV